MEYSSIITACALLFAGSVCAQQQDTVKVNNGDTQIKVSSDHNVIIQRNGGNSDQDSLAMTVKKGATDTIKLGDDVLVLIKHHGDNQTVVKDSESKKTKKNELSYWQGMDVGVNGLLNSNYGLDLGPGNEKIQIDYAHSRVVSFNMLQFKARLVKDYVGLLTGLSVQFNSYKLLNDYDLSFFNDSIFGTQSGSRNNQKNKLRATYLGIPLLVEFNTSEKPKKSFHLSAGVIGRLKIGSMYKEKYKEAGNTYKTSKKGNLYFNTWQLDATVRIGYGWVTLFGTVGLQPFFKDGVSPKSYAWSTGIALRV